MAGKLVLVVGPSGVGKDAMINGAKQKLAGKPEIVFPRREVTRAPHSEGEEDDILVDEATFKAREISGVYIFWWRAHGLSYGIPASIEHDLHADKVVIINVSRELVPAVRERYGRIKVLSVAANHRQIEERLKRRGRESDEETESRLARATSFSVTGPDVQIVWNDGTIADGVERFTAAILADDYGEVR